MKTRKTADVARGATALLVAGMVFGLVACQDLTATSTTGATLAASDASTSTSLLVEETTITSGTLLEPPVKVTNESGQSPCLIVDAYTRNGKNYVVVDYIQVKWPTGAYEPKITNTNSKLRTFVVPDDAMVGWGPDFSGFAMDVHGGGDVNLDWTEWGYWDITVSGGSVTSLISGWGPDYLGG